MFVANSFEMANKDLVNQWKGLKYYRQNPADSGEICEKLVKNMLKSYLSDLFKVSRGGKIIALDTNEGIVASKQIDIVLTGKNTLKIFGNKGLYPVECVYGVFSVTAKLTKTKLDDCIEEFKSIPKDSPRIDCGVFDKSKIATNWSELFPYKCVLGFDGSIDQEWEVSLNDLVNEDSSKYDYLPDIIVVLEKGMITKINRGATYLDGSSIPANKKFHFVDFSLSGVNYAYLAHILNRLYVLSTWQYHVTPNYASYFNAEMRRPLNQ